jgi:hypothetical protein
MAQVGLATFRYVSGHYGRVLDFEPAEMVISTLSDQGVVWIGAMVSPVMPALGCLGNAVTFALQRWALLHACAPVRQQFSANRSSTVPYAMLLGMLSLCTVPATYWLSEVRSESCGPIRGRSMVRAPALPPSLPPSCVCEGAL